MKKINLSILHLLIVIVTFMFTLKGQDSYSRRYETPILLSEHNQSTDQLKLYVSVSTGEMYWLEIKS